MSKLNLRNIRKDSEIFETYGPIEGYHIPGYPDGYDPENLPHENTLIGAIRYCVDKGHTGVCFNDGRYEVRSGEYLEFFEFPRIIKSWVLF